MKNIIVIFLSLVLFAAGCNSPSSSPSSPKEKAKEVDKDDAFVTNLNANIIGPRVKSFYSEVVDLKQAIYTACSSEMRVRDLKEKWQKAMMSFHYLEAVAVGALGENERSLAKHIYSWDKDSVIAPVYTQMRRAHNNPNYKFKKRRVKYKGLYALELIFYDKYGQEKFIQAGDKACPYINMIADDLEVRAEELSERWVTEQIYYFQDPKNKLNYGEYISEVVAQTQYVYSVVQHKKVAPLLGEENHDNITACEKNTTEHRCIEHKFSGLTQEALVQNIEALKDVFSGRGGFGMAAYMEILNQKSEADKVLQLLDGVLNEWELTSEGESFLTKVEQYKTKPCSEELLCRGFIKLAELGKWIKEDFLILMNTELPKPVQGDND